MQFKDCSLPGLRYWLPLSLVDGDDFSACRRLITDPSTGLKPHCSSGRKSASDRSQLVPSQPGCPGHSSVFAGLTKQVKSLYQLRAALRLFQTSPITLPWPSLDQGKSENKMLKFSFTWKQCHIRQLKKTRSQHKLSVRFVGPLHYTAPCFIIYRHGVSWVFIGMSHVGTGSGFGDAV